MTQEELKMELEELAVRFSKGWHEGIKIDASDIMLLNEAAQALAQPAQEPVAWKLMPRDATDAMLKAMDECSTEGYDERLYAGHAASVYMAAWDASDTAYRPSGLAQLEQEPVADDFFRMIADRNSKPFSTPQRTWVGLTDDDTFEIGERLGLADVAWVDLMQAIESKLKQKNGYADSD